MGWDGMGWMEWDVMGCGMAWDEMRWAGMGWDGMAGKVRVISRSERRGRRLRKGAAHLRAHSQGTWNAQVCAR